MQDEQKKRLAESLCDDVIELIHKHEKSLKRREIATMMYTLSCKYVAENCVNAEVARLLFKRINEKVLEG